MPYIKEEDREDLQYVRALDAGQLNFQITSIVDTYLTTKGVNYGNINEAIGVLECAKLELYRRIASPYEDIKLRDNGEVYDSILKVKLAGKEGSYGV